MLKYLNSYTLRANRHRPFYSPGAKHVRATALEPALPAVHTVTGDQINQKTQHNL